jgi:CSLREA domain-containing protein
MIGVLGLILSLAAGASLASINQNMLTRGLWPVADKRQPPTHNGRWTADQMTVDATGRGNPWLNLLDDRDLPMAYAGAAGLKQVLQDGLAQPVALAAGDFDEDGVPDLIAGYVGPGGGIITLHRGNLKSQWGNGEMGKRENERAGSLTHLLVDPLTPFLPEARVFEVPEAPDFLGAGDFDADGHGDIVAAAQEGEALYLLPGDGRGGLGSVKPIPLPGRVTALVTGEINRRDGLTDIVVGVMTPDGPQALVFESPGGALTGEPEIFSVPATVTALALGQLAGDPAIDLAVAAGHELMIVHGRDRRLSIADCRLQIADCSEPHPPAVIEQRTFPFVMQSLALGDFIRDEAHRTEIAVLSDDGTVHVLQQHPRPTQDPRPKTQDPRLKAEWRDEVQTHLPIDSLTHLSRLVRANVSSLPTDDLIVVDQENHRLCALLDLKRVNESTGQRVNDSLTHLPVDPLTVSLDTDGAVVAVLPLRLNADALSDLVILREGSSTPTVVLTAPLATFTVSSIADTDDGACTVGPGGCTLREALNAANATPGADAINFMIGTGTPTITLSGVLPPIAESVTINGNTGGATRIELNGNNVADNGLRIIGGSSAVRSLVINRCTSHGIRLETNGGNIVEDSFIGTDQTGSTSLGNKGSGVLISDSPGNTIGGTTSSQRNVISGNDGSPSHGVQITGPAATMNVVAGNYIGTNTTGAVNLGNLRNGVIIDGAPNNTIGGTAPGAGNIISGNGRHGVEITKNGSMGNVVQDNFIGTDAGGATALGNSFSGVLVGNSASGNTVGGSAPGAGNVISGNAESGVLIQNSGTNQVQGNIIGLNAAGMAVLPNSFDGVRIGGSATGNTVGGATAGARNVISGNTQNGVGISGSGSNQVQGNYIGTDITGVLDRGNTLDGVFINQAPSNTIGGTTFGAGNIISGNDGHGVELTGGGATMNLIQGNFIGTDVLGFADLGNSLDGVFIASPNNTVGGTTSIPGTPPANVISGNDTNGVEIAGSAATGNLVQGNFIGLDSSGVTPFSNTLDGVLIVDASNNTIGGTTTGARNVISGNGARGVGIDRLSGPATGNLVQGNFIGTDAGGAADVGNSIHGVGVFAATNTIIGGSTSTPGAPPGNVISGNSFRGVAINLSGGNQVKGNLIGTDVTGAIDLGNSQEGVIVANGPNNIIGGTAFSERNVISGNNSDGVCISGAGATGNQVQGNFIGAVSGGSLGNGGHGVHLTISAHDNIIGGTTNGFEGNIIAFNSGDGVFAEGGLKAAGLGNAIRGNSIFENTGLGIDLSSNGVTMNDLGSPPDSDTGPNNVQNFPVITSVSLNGNTTIQGTLDSTPNRTFTLDFYSNGCDPSGFGEGTNFLGSGTVTTNSSGTVSFTITLPFGVIEPGETMTATATDPSGNTSEFSACVDPCAGSITCPANLTQSNDPGQCGAVITYPPPTTTGACGTVTCAPVSGAFFPVGTTTVTCTASGGLSCSFTVTVNDPVLPSLTCAGNITQTADPGQCTAIVNFNPTATDNCPVTVVCNPASGAAFPVGTTTVTCAATDAGGLTASCSFTVTVNDTQPPSLTCPANLTRSTDLNQCSAVVTLNVTATDNCPGVTFTCSPPSGPTFPKGTTTVTCTATDAVGLTASCSFTVTVNDTQPPNLTCAGNLTIPVAPGQCAAVVNYTAPTVSDNCPGVGTPSCTPPSGSTFPVGTTTVTCTAVDAAGNNASCSFTVRVTETQPPSLTCPGNLTVPAGALCRAVVNYSATATDNCPGVIVACNPASGASFPLGTTTVTCTATDASGNTANCSFTVAVTNAPPVANAGPDQTVSEGATVTLNGSSSSDANPGQTLSLQWTQTGGPAVSLTGANTATATFTAPNVADLQCVSLIFQLKVTDSCGAMATDTVTVTVTDRFALRDDRNGHCVIITRACGMGNMGQYCWRKPDGSTVSGACTITVQGTVLTVQSKPEDPNLFQAGADLARGTGNARLTETRANPTRTSTIFDSNIRNSTCNCP